MYTKHLKFTPKNFKKVRHYAVFRSIIETITFQKTEMTSISHENNSQKNDKLITYSNTDYSMDDHSDKFYHWIEHICIPIKNNVELKEDGWSNQYDILRIRKQICASVNDAPDENYYVNSFHIGSYLEYNQVPVEQVYLSKKIFITRLKAINLIGKKKLLGYYEQGKLPAICNE